MGLIKLNKMLWVQKKIARANGYQLHKQLVTEKRKNGEGGEKRKKEKR